MKRCNSRSAPIGSQKNRIKKSLSHAAIFVLSLSAAFMVSTAYAQPPRDTRPEIVLHVGHSFNIDFLTYSSDGKLLASAGEDDTIKLWDANTLELIRTFQRPAHTRTIDALAFSPDGKSLISASEDSSARLWDVETGKLIRSFETQDETTAAAISPDGNILATGSRDDKLRLWSVPTGKMLCEGAGNASGSQIPSLAFTPDGKRLASAGEDDVIRFWNPNTCSLIFTMSGQTEDVFSLDFSKDGSLLAAAGEDGGINLWSMESKQIVRTINTNSPFVFYASFTYDGKGLISLDANGYVILWNVEDGGHAATLATAYDAITFALNPDGESLALGNRSGVIELYDAKTGDFTNTTEVYNSVVRILAFSPDGKTLAVADYDDGILIWNLEAGRIEHTLQGHSDSVYSLAYTPDGKELFAAGFDDTITVWDSETGDLIRTIEATDTYMIDVTFSPDRKIIATTTDHNVIQLFNAETGKPLQKISPPEEDEVLAFDFVPDSEYLIIGTNGEIADIYNLWTKTFECDLEGENYRPYSMLAFSPDGRYMAAATEYDSELPIDLWNLDTGELAKTFQAQWKNILYLSFSPDGKEIIIAGDGKIMFRNITTGELTRTFEDNAQNNFLPLAFHPGGKLLAFGSYSAGIKFWNMDTGRLLATLYLFPDGNWLATDPGSRFDCSGCDTDDPDGAEKYFRWRAGNTIYLAYKFFDEYYTPGLMKKALALANPH